MNSDEMGELGGVNAEEWRVVVGRLGFVFGALLEHKPATPTEALMLVANMHNQADDGGDEWTAAVCDALGSGLLAYIDNHESDAAPQ